MSEAKWTPGVWSSAPREIAGEGWAVSSDHTFVNSRGGTWHEYVAQYIKNEETARLISAAPDLFKALNALLEDFGGDAEGPLIDSAKAAVAKARGEATK